MVNGVEEYGHPVNPPALELTGKDQPLREEPAQEPEPSHQSSGGLSRLLRGKKDKPDTAPSEQPKNIIFIIRDGASFTIDEAARQIKGAPLNIDPYLRGAVRTTPYIAEDHPYGEGEPNQNITDSASAATAFACGISTFNGYIGISPDGQPCRTLIDVAEDLGMTTAVVANMPLHHATPAAFITHGTDRYDYPALAANVLTSGVDHYIGLGGIEYYLPETRDDGRDLLSEFETAGYTVFRDSEVFRQLGSGDNQPHQVLAILGNRDTPSYPIAGPQSITEESTLPTWSELLFTTLDLAASNNNDNGFFIVIEAGKIDYAAHTFDLATAARLVLSSDQAIGDLSERIKTDPALENTLVVITSDHGTGGFTIGSQDRFDWNPDFLADVEVSAWWMYEQFQSGNSDLEQLLLDYTPIKELTEEELSLIASLTPDADKWEVTRVIGRIITTHSGTGMTTGGHIGDPVPVYAVGPGANEFQGIFDNTELHTLLRGFLEERDN